MLRMLHLAMGALRLRIVIVVSCAPKEMWWIAHWNIQFIHSIHVSINIYIYIIKIWYRIEWSRKASPYIWRVGKSGSGCSRTGSTGSTSGHRFSPEPKAAQKSFCCPRESPYFAWNPHLKIWHETKVETTYQPPKSHRNPSRIATRSSVPRPVEVLVATAAGSFASCLLLAAAAGGWATVATASGMVKQFPQSYGSIYMLVK